MKVPLPIAHEAVGLTARRMVVWGQIPVYCTTDWIHVRDLVATQEEVSSQRLAELLYVTCPGPIEVALIDGRYVIVDGHHRATAAIERGHSLIFAAVRSTERSKAA